MRRYNGKPMINSVSAKAESMAAVFPLVKKYGGEMETQPGDGCYTVSVMVFAKGEAPIMT